jgi:hypothetical protein
MRTRTYFLLALAALVPAGVSRRASAEDALSRYELVLPDGGVRFQVTRDLPRGTMHFTTAGLQKVTAPPVFTLQSADMPEAITVQAVAGEDGTWRLSHALLTSEQFEGTVSVQVEDRKYTAPLVLRVVHSPRHGGHFLEMCHGLVEAVHLLSSGTVTVYFPENSKLTETPVIALSEPAGASEVVLQAVPGRRSVWKAQSPLFKTTKVAGALRARIDGEYCEAEIVFVGVHGGRIVKWPGGLRYEIAPDPNAKNGYLVYFLDDTWAGKAYTIERPMIVWGTGANAQSFKLEPFDHGQRAYRIPGVGVNRLRPEDGRLRLSLAGRTLETTLGGGSGVLAAR